MIGAALDSLLAEARQSHARSARGDAPQPDPNLKRTGSFVAGSKDARRRRCASDTGVRRDATPRSTRRQAGCPSR